MRSSRTVLIWFNNDEERIVFPINPKDISVSRPQPTQEIYTVDGQSAHISKGEGLKEVVLSTFLPSPQSRFFDGTRPYEALALLKKWQDSRRPVRLIISDTDINDAFLITELVQTISEGDMDVEISIRMKEYKFLSLSGGLTVSNPGGLEARPDERPERGTYTVKKGDTLWAIAVKYYGDGTRWKEIADKNGITNPRTLQIGKVLVL